MRCRSNHPADRWIRSEPDCRSLSLNRPARSRPGRRGACHRPGSCHNGMKRARGARFRLMRSWRSGFPDRHERINREPTSGCRCAASDPSGRCHVTHRVSSDLGCDREWRDQPATGSSVFRAERSGTRGTAVGMYICSLEEGTQMSYLPSITGHLATPCRRRGRQPVTRGRRLRLVAPTFAAMAPGTVLAVPAMAATGPSLTAAK
jgi:hypothetical protein